MTWNLFRARRKLVRRPITRRQCKPTLEILEDRTLLSFGAPVPTMLPARGAGGFDLTRVVTGDFNHDTKPDIALANTDGSDGENTVAVFTGGLGTNGAFTPFADVNPRTNPPGAVSGNKTNDLAVGDFNKDGFDDLAVLMKGYVRIYPGGPNGFGAFTDVGLRVGLTANRLAAGDFHNLGRPELVVLGDNHFQVVRFDSVQPTLQVGSVNTTGNSFTFLTPINFSRAVTGDFTGDGQLDIAADGYVGNDPQKVGDPNSIVVLKAVADAAGFFQVSSFTPLPTSQFSYFTAAKLDSDNISDLAVLGTDSPSQNVIIQKVSLLRGRAGDAGFEPLGTPVTVGGADPGQAGVIVATRALAVGQFTGDGNLDLATGYASGINVYEGLGNGAFGPAQLLLSGQNTSEVSGLVAANFTGSPSGGADLATVTFFPANVSVLPNLGGPTVQLTQSSDYSETADIVTFTASATDSLGAALTAGSVHFQVLQQDGTVFKVADVAVDSTTGQATLPTALPVGLTGIKATYTSPSGETSEASVLHLAGGDPATLTALVTYEGFTSPDQDKPAWTVENTGAAGTGQGNVTEQPAGGEWFMYDSIDNGGKLYRRAETGLNATVDADISATFRLVRDANGNLLGTGTSAIAFGMRDGERLLQFELVSLTGTTGVFALKGASGSTITIPDVTIENQIEVVKKDGGANVEVRLNGVAAFTVARANLPADTGVAGFFFGTPSVAGKAYVAWDQVKYGIGRGNFAVVPKQAAKEFYKLEVQGQVTGPPVSNGLAFGATPASAADISPQAAPRDIFVDSSGTLTIIVTTDNASKPPSVQINLGVSDNGTSSFSTNLSNEKQPALSTQFVYTYQFFDAAAQLGEVRVTGTDLEDRPVHPSVQKFSVQNDQTGFDIPTLKFQAIPNLDIPDDQETIFESDSLHNITIDPSKGPFTFTVLSDLNKLLYPDNQVLIYPIGRLPDSLELLDANTDKKALRSVGTKDKPAELIGTFHPQSYEAGQEYELTFGILDTVTGLSRTATMHLAVKGDRASFSTVVTTEPGDHFNAPPQDVPVELNLRIKTTALIQTFPTVYEKPYYDSEFRPISFTADQFTIDGDSILFHRRFTANDPVGIYQYFVVARGYESNEESLSNTVSFYLGQPSAVTNQLSSLLTPGSPLSPFLGASGGQSLSPVVGDRVLFAGDEGLRFTYIETGAIGNSSGNFTDRLAFAQDGTAVTLRQFDGSFQVISRGGGNVISRGAGSVISRGGGSAISRGGGSFSVYSLFNNTRAFAISRGGGSAIGNSSGNFITPFGIVAPGAAGIVLSGPDLANLIPARLISEDSSGFAAELANGNALQLVKGASLGANTGNVGREAADFIGKGTGTAIGNSSGNIMQGAAAQSFGAFDAPAGDASAGTDTQDFSALAAPAGVASAPGGAVYDATLHAHFMILHAEALQVPGKTDSADVTNRVNAAKADLAVAGVVADSNSFDGLTAGQIATLQRAFAVSGFTVAPATGTVFTPGGRIVLTLPAGQTFAAGSATAPTNGSFTSVLAGVVATISGDFPQASQPSVEPVSLPLNGQLLQLFSVAPDRIEARLPDFLDPSKPLLIMLTTSDGKLGMAAVEVTAVAKFQVTASASATSGSPLTFTVTAQDAAGNLVSSYAGTVHFSSTDGLATLPANSTLTSGVGSFTATFRTGGNQFLTASDSTTSAIAGISSSISLNVPAITHFAVSAPVSATAGSSFTFTVTTLDSFNNTVTGYAGTVHFTSSDSIAVLPANAILTNGVGVFSSTLKTSGSQTLTVTDTVTSVVQGTSNTVGVSSPLDADHRFIQHLYFALLGRLGAVAEHDGWITNLKLPGQTLQSIAIAIEHSLEARTRLVKGWYAKFLGRQAGNGEEQGWVQALLHGATEDQTQAQILASAEFAARANALIGTANPPANYVHALYRMLLNRIPAPVEVNGWLQTLPALGGTALAAGRFRFGSDVAALQTLQASAVALAFLESFEYRALRVSAYYTELLHRQADSTEVLAWNVLAIDLETIRYAIESSQEFYLNG